MNDSIYSFISNAVGPDGLLPADFDLPKKKEDDKPLFADGALDGIQIYHMGFKVIEEPALAELLEILRTANSGEYDKAEKDLSGFFKEFRAIEIIDEVQNQIIDHKEELTVQSMAEFAYRLITGSSDTEVIKCGLIILELVDTSSDPELMNVIRMLGLSDEFTIFSVFVMRHWPDAQMEVLDLARKVHGWGRIHCVKYIEPVNDEITKWLLFNGIDNSVLHEYSALTVFNKIQVEDMLDSDELKADEFSGILKIVDSMLVEGPVQGISAVEDPPALLAKVLDAAGRFEPDEEDKKIIADISDLKKRYAGG